MTAAYILAVIFIFVLVKHGIDANARRESERLRLIEEALRQGSLDQHGRDALTAALTGQRPPRATRPQPASGDAGFFFKLMAFIGWLALCVGVAFLIILNNTRGYYDELMIPGTVLTCVGFGLVTFPFIVLRELTARRAARRT